MLVVCTIAIFLLFILVFVIFNHDLLAPTVIFALTCFVGSAVAVYGNLQWKVEVNSPMVLISYTLGIIAMGAGELVVSEKNIRIKSNRSFYFNNNCIISIPNCVCFIACLYCCVIAYLVGRRYIQIAYSYGYSGEWWQSRSRYIKEALAYGGYHIGILLATAYAVLNVLMYVFLFSFILNVVNRGVKKTIKHDWMYLIPIVPWGYVQNIQAQRTGFLGLIAFVIYCYTIMKWTKKKKKISVIKIGLTLIFSVSLFYLIFIIIGSMSGRLIGSALENILVYTGSAIVDFSDYVNKQYHSSFPGIASFSGFISTINRFGVSIKGSSKLGFVTFANGSASNVYGALASYYADFGIIGIILIQFILGIAYRILYNSARRGNSLFAVFLFGYFSYGLVMAFIGEQQTTLFLGVGQIMFIIIAIIIFPKLIYKYYAFINAEKKGARNNLYYE